VAELTLWVGQVDDWTAAIARFKNGATGVWEGSTVMKGYKYGGFGKEWAEVNGSVATAVYQMGDPNNLLFGKHGESLEPIPVPPEFLVIEGSPRDPTQGVPSAVFRCAPADTCLAATCHVHHSQSGFSCRFLASPVARFYCRLCVVAGSS
jgi:predicted dehydrogenase